MGAAHIEPYAEVGKRLVKLAQAANLSGISISRLTENRIRPSRWTEYTQGKRQITVEAAIDLCRITGATLDYIYRGDESGLPKRLIEAFGFRAA